MSEISPSKTLINNDNFDFEAQQNWDGFWDLLLKEDMKQNPELYIKKTEKND